MWGACAAGRQAALALHPEPPGAACPGPPLPCSALSAAVLSGSADMVRLLVDAGACTGGRGGNSGGHVRRGHPALRAVALAAQRGRVDMIEVLYPPLVQALQGEGGVSEVGRHDISMGRDKWHPVKAHV